MEKMKKLITLLTLGLIIMISLPVLSQVSININGDDPDPSAMLVPRMTMAERNAINGGTFATGLLIYQTDNTPGYYYYDGSTWQGIVGGDDNDWTISGSNMYSAVSGNVGIGTMSPASALSIGDVGDNRWKAYVYQSSTVNGASGLRATVAAPSSGGSISLYGVLGKAEITNGNSAFHIGVYGIAYRSSALHVGRSYGVIGYAGNCGDGWNYGVFGRLGGTQDGAAIYGTLTGDVDVNGQWAGYFNGNVYADGNVGIGTTSPAYALDVNSGDAIAGQFDGRVIGDDAVNNDEFVTLGQLSSGAGLWTDDGAYIHPTEAGTNVLAITDAGNVGIGTATPDASAMLEVKSTEKGFLPPQMTESQRDAINSPADGLVIFNTTSDCLNFYAAGYWNETCGSPIVPTVYNPTTGETWMDRNLGASQVATSSTDAAAYGDLYQWGRATEGHEDRTSGQTFTYATSAVPNGGNAWDGLFITALSSPYDWLTPQDNTLWQGAGGTNSPCPAGFRLPTEAEWEAERNSWASNNTAGAFGSPLKLVVGGYRSHGTGSLGYVGSYGYYWSSSVSGTGTRRLYFHSSDAGIPWDNRAYGFSVRCIRD